jgi:prevent-host-death family protein
VLFSNDRKYRREQIMPTVTLDEAKAQLDLLIELVEAGEEVTISKGGLPVVCMVPSPKPQKLPSLAAFRATQPEQSESAGDFIRRLRETDRY